MEADTPEQRAYYIGQVQYFDGLVLDIVTTLLRRSTAPPVILMVGDHRPRFADVGFYGHPDSVSSAFIRELHPVDPRVLGADPVKADAEEP